MARSFDGVDDVITTAAVVPPSSGYTMSMWLRASDVTATDVFFVWGQRIASENYFNQNIILNKDIYFRIFEGSVLGDFIGRIATASVTSNNIWYHICGTWDGGTTNASCKIFINGVQKDDANSGSGIFTGSNTNSIIKIFGAQEVTPSGYDNLFSGQIAHTQLFNRPLSAGEIRQIMQFPGSLSRGLIGYWPLWGSGSPEPDYSGNGNNGTVTGAIKGTSEPPINGIFQVPRPELVRSF